MNPEASKGSQVQGIAFICAPQFHAAKKTRITEAVVNASQSEAWPPVLPHNDSMADSMAYSIAQQRPGFLNAGDETLEIRVL